MKTVGIVELLQSAFSGLFETVASGRRSVEVAELVKEVEVTAKLKASLMAMKSQVELQKYLLESVESVDQPIKTRDAHRAMELGIEMLESFWECHQKWDIQPSAFFKSYQTALDLFRNTFDDPSSLSVEESLWSSKRGLLFGHNEIDEEKALTGVMRNAPPVVSHLMRRLNQKHAEITARPRIFDMKEEVFYEFYQASMSKPLTDEELGVAKQYWKNRKKQSQYASPGLKKLDLGNLMQVLGSNQESTKAIGLFEACKRMLAGHTEARRYAKQQAFFRAMDLNVGVLEEFTRQHRKELINGEININQRFSENGEWELVNGITEDSETALTWLIKWKAQDSDAFSSILAILCGEGADINAIANSRTQWTPLHIAVMHKSWQTIPFLMQKGVNCALQDFKGRTALSALIDEIDAQFENSYHMESRFYENRLNFLSKIYIPLQTLISSDIVRIKDSVPKQERFSGSHASTLQGTTPLFKFLFYSFKLFDIQSQDDSGLLDDTASVRSGEESEAPPSV
jgi:hypothetical protein